MFSQGPLTDSGAAECCGLLRTHAWVVLIGIECSLNVIERVAGSRQGAGTEQLLYVIVSTGMLRVPRLKDFGWCVSRGLFGFGDR